MADITTSAAGATQAAVAQKLSTAAVKTANDAQKQEGQAAVELIKSLGQQIAGPTGNKVDIQV